MAGFPRIRGVPRAPRAPVAADGQQPARHAPEPDPEHAGWHRVGLGAGATCVTLVSARDTVGGVGTAGNAGALTGVRPPGWIASQCSAREVTTRRALCPWVSDETAIRGLSVLRLNPGSGVAPERDGRSSLRLLPWLGSWLFRPSRPPCRARLRRPLRCPFRMMPTFRQRGLISPARTSLSMLPVPSRSNTRSAIDPRVCFPGTPCVGSWTSQGTTSIETSRYGWIG
jgi:hypothetical protein